MAKKTWMIAATNLPMDRVIAITREASESLAFKITVNSEHEFQLRKSNLPLSIIAGALVVYCNFKMTVAEMNSVVQITIERNNPWWTGLIGLRRVENAARKLAERMQEFLTDDGASVNVDER